MLTAIYIFWFWYSQYLSLIVLSFFFLWFLTDFFCYLRQALCLNWSLKSAHLYLYMVELQEAEKPTFHNYRHLVSQCPVSTLDWLSNYPHKAWVDPGKGSFTCQVNRRERKSNRNCLCSNRSPWPQYHGANWLYNKQAFLDCIVSFICVFYPPV